MKSNLFKYFVPVLFALPFFISCNKDPEEVSLDFDITVPENWREVQAYPQGLVYTAERKPVDVLDTITPGLYVYKLYMPDYTLDEFYMEVKDMILQDKLYKSTIRESDTTINQIDYKKMVTKELMVYIEPESHDTLYADIITERFVNLLYVNAPSGYYFTFYSPLDQYPSEKLIFNQIMSSVYFKTN